MIREIPQAEWQGTRTEAGGKELLVVFSSVLRISRDQVVPLAFGGLLSTMFRHDLLEIHSLRNFRSPPCAFAYSLSF